MNTVHSGSLNDHHLDPERSLALRRAAKASFIGNFIEWFDYASYGYLATVIGLAFFPEADKTVRLMSAYAVFAMSFILRPIGAIGVGSLGRPMGDVVGLCLGRFSSCPDRPSSSGFFPHTRL